MAKKRVEFSQDLFDDICEQIAEGESLREICLAENRPSRTAVFNWLSANEKLVDQYARARETQADYYVDQIIKIADEATPEDVNVARVKIDARKWTAGKLRPKVYGDKVDLNHGGSFNVIINGDDADL